jgi:hypothetical protein
MDTITPKRKSLLRRRSTWIVGGVAGLGLLAAGAVQAQWDRGPGWRGQHGEMGMGRGGERGQRFARFCANDTERFAPVARAYVKADLRLDARQSGEFDRLADIVLPGLAELKREVCNDFATRTAPTPERLAALAENLRRAADLAQASVEPARQFYGTLDERQKARVDELAERRSRGPR